MIRGLTLGAIGCIYNYHRSKACRKGTPSPSTAPQKRSPGNALQREFACSTALLPPSTTTDGKLPPVGNTVDVRNANWTNTIGAAELATVWTDPDFDKHQKAFYYARVIEIPTPRWTTYDAFRFGIPIPEGAPTSTQDRAYTSPIWYTP